jgi:riboflavin kinase/FMN adenylyltransferase
MREMKVQREPAPLPDGAAACLGAFDGMHLGHQALLARGRELCKHVALVTFDPHPAQLLAPTRAPPLLQTPLQRERACRALGVDTLVLLRFDQAMAALSAQAFVQRYMLEGLRPQLVIVGEDFRFGADRKGSTLDLGELLAPSGMSVSVVPDLCAPFDPSTRLSSSVIRAALTEGAVERASTLLGRPHAVLGSVARGTRRGRKLGFPTANVDCPGAFLPKPGTYAAALTVWERTSRYFGQIWPSVANLGQRPTFTAGSDRPPVLEVHVLDVDLGDDLYGAEVEVSFVRRLRDELAFPDVDGLVAQIHADIDASRPYLSQDNLVEVIRPADP